MKPTHAADPAAALRRLREWQRVRPEGALERLYAWRGALSLIGLYKHFFPREFARAIRKLSAASLEPKESWNPYTPLEAEFFRLVSRRLFPIADWLADEQIDERLDFIPVETQAIDYEYLNDYRPGLQLLAALAGILADYDWDNPLRAPRPVTLERESALDWQRFVRLCRRAGGPLADMPVALAVVTREAGNFWLDYDDEMLAGFYFELDWSIETMEALHREWQEARRLLRRFNRAVEGLEQQPHLAAQLIILWNRACVEKNEKPDDLPGAPAGR